VSGDNYPTDEWILSIFDGWFDPCPLDPNPIIDALDHSFSWGEVHERIFINPPYSNPLPWVERAIYEIKNHDCTIVMLLKHDTSTKWFSKLHEAGARFLLVNGRLKHRTTKAAPFPSVLAVLSSYDADRNFTFANLKERTLDEY